MPLPANAPLRCPQSLTAIVATRHPKPSIPFILKHNTLCYTVPSAIIRIVYSSPLHIPLALVRTTPTTSNLSEERIHDKGNSGVDQRHVHPAHARRARHCVGEHYESRPWQRASGATDCIAGRAYHTQWLQLIAWVRQAFLRRCALRTHTL